MRTCCWPRACCSSRTRPVLQIEKDPRLLPDLLPGSSYDVILLDMNFDRDATGGGEGLEWLGRILELDPDAVVVMITAYGDVELAVRAIKAGATDFVLKPWQNEKLLATLSAAASLRRSRQEADRLRSCSERLGEDLDRSFHELIGDSPSMRRVFETVRKVAATEANVLITGENGTGKELVARALHRQSPRAGRAFIGVDMGAVSENLFESELFGHVRGAFTDAREDRAGRFEVAQGGTIFLDEIGNLSPPLQAKLLQVLENRTVTRLGANKPIPLDVRLICATNLPIGELVEQNRFRQDLLYRINTVEIQLPPLRERPEDLPLLARHFLGEYCRKYHRPGRSIGAAALEKLKRHHWPGNVRELRHALERAVILSEEQVLQPEAFPLSAPPPRGEAGEPAFEDYNMERVEKLVIRKAIEKHGGNLSRAARELGLTRSALYRRLERYGL